MRRRPLTLATFTVAALALACDGCPNDTTECDESSGEGCAQSCPDGQVRCDDECVDPQTDPRWCGVGPQCEDTEAAICEGLTQRCRAGVCVDATGEDLPELEPGEPGSTQDLGSDWQLAPASEADDGTRVSTLEFDASDWLEASVPTTVLAAMVAAGKLPDPAYGLNLRDMPGGRDVDIGENFSNFDMADDNPFRAGYWFRREFDVPHFNPGTRTLLELDGVNYRAEVWLDGERLADADEVVGTFREWEFDLSDRVEPDSPHTLAVLVHPPEVQSLAHTFVDWMPMPGDKDMGLWRPVRLRFSRDVDIVATQVRSDVDGTRARLEVDVDLRNRGSEARDAELTLRLGPSLELRQSVPLEADSTRTITLSHLDHPRLTLEDAPLWWPYELGEPRMHSISANVVVDDTVHDRHRDRFGIREVQSQLDEGGYRRFSINGRPLFIRGSGYAPDLMLRYDPRRERRELELVRDMNLNVVRLEGKFGSDSLIESADELGVLLMPGWCCCDHWELWDRWSEEDHEVARASLRDQSRRLRSHPSMLMWLNGSDRVAPAEVERDYVDILEDERFDVPVLSSATASVSEVSGPSGAKMAGPYDYVPPSYWFDPDNDRGGPFGFATEIGPGPSLPLRESLERFIPEHALWPTDNEHWTVHAGGGQFDNLRIFDDALARRLGPPDDLDDYLAKAQLLGYEAQRAMFEGFRARKFAPATGIIQWMLNDGFPSTIWHLYDYYLIGAGSYYGAKKANMPVHALYDSTGDRIHVVQSTDVLRHDLELRIRAYDANLNLVFEREDPLDLVEDGRVELEGLESADLAEGLHFLDLRLFDDHDRLVDHNFYWLSTRADVLDWARSTWYHTPMSQFGDFSQLAALAPTELSVTAQVRHEASSLERRRFTISLENPSDDLAFFVRLWFTVGEAGPELAPSFWADNYLSLLPGERRSIDVELESSSSIPSHVHARGHNVPHALYPIESERSGPSAQLPASSPSSINDVGISAEGWPEQTTHN